MLGPFKACTHLADLLSADVLSANSGWLQNMFDRGCQQTIIETVLESADSAVESADSSTNLAKKRRLGKGPYPHTNCLKDRH